jgi:acyl-CoA ligase (AMP-forming) (exosortase A-associated)
MNFPTLLHDLIDHSAHRTPDAIALACRGQRLSYAALQAVQDGFALGTAGAVARGERIAIYLPKSVEAVGAAFGAAKAGACFVPINPVLKAPQVQHILADCAVRLLITTAERYRQLLPQLRQCTALQRVVLTGEGALPADAGTPWRLERWAAFCAPAHAPALPRGADIDMAAILYTSGSTGKPKGVVISHRNLVGGAQSVASYLGNNSADRILALLPLSFDAGFSQLTTGFLTGACVVLHEFLLAADALRVMADERITALTCVPPLWIQLAEQEWPEAAAASLRYFANTGGKMPRSLLERLRRLAPQAEPFLMYGLTEAFRSTFLPPALVDSKPDSIGRAIPNQEILVLRPDCSECGADEVGELVHRGSTVSLGYWNDMAKTAERFRLLPARHAGLMLPEYAVFSGDLVRRDRDGDLYFIGRNDDMIKSSGYRISPVEVEEAAYASGMVQEAVALGVDDERLGQAVALVLLPLADGAEGFVEARLLQALRGSLPSYMLPRRIVVVAERFARNGNGKIDRKQVAAFLARQSERAVGAEVAP